MSIELFIKLCKVNSNEKKNGFWTNYSEIINIDFTVNKKFYSKISWFMIKKKKKQNV